jgi:hypothetical protein
MKRCEGGVMEATNEASQELYARVATYLRQSFGELAEESDSGEAFYLALSRSVFVIRVVAVNEDAAVLHIYTWVGRGLTVTGEVATHLLTKNYGLWFGTLGLDTEGEINFEHAFPSTSVTKEGLSRVLRHMSASAEEIDNELSMLFR